MEETFKGEAKIIDKLKAEAIKASDKLIAAQLTMDAMQKRLNAFNLEMDLTTGEIKPYSKQPAYIVETDLTGSGIKKLG